MTEETAGTLETRADAGTGEPARVKLWLEALDLAEKHEEKWREMARLAVKRYRQETADKSGARFNILHSNIETLAPALYNSTPVPDVRRRHGDTDPVGKVASQAIERCLAYAVDSGNPDYDFDGVIKAVVHNSLLVGRGVPRVRYEPTFDKPGEGGVVVDEAATSELVDWRDFRRGPGRRWSEVPWIGFRHRITRDDAVEKFGEVGATINLDWTEKDSDKDTANPPDIFKRATVWEIWDKDKREVVFIAPSHKEKALKVEPDPLGLRGFFPAPRPLYDIEDPDDMTPIVPYEIYRNQAQELDDITDRISKLVKVMKWRGVRAGDVAEFDKLKDADDGDLVPSEDITAWIDKGGLEKAVWLMPIERLITVIRELVLQREAVKQTIFELTGVADIMRGQSNPNETLGAQRIKSEWGSLRLQKRQREVQRIARDLIRLKAEIMAEKFSPETLIAMTGMQMPAVPQPQQMAPPQPGQPGQPPAAPVEQKPSWAEVFALLQRDQARGFRIDIETDSTIRGDLGYAQENAAKFIEGIGGFFTVIGPAVEAQAMPMDVATDLLIAFSRQFKLGRQAEDALERLGQQAEEKANAPAGAAQPDPAAQAELQAQAMEQRMAQQAAQQEAQVAQADLQLKAQKMQLEHAELQLKAQKMQQEAQRAGAEFDFKSQELQLDAVLKREAIESKEIIEADKRVTELRIAAQRQTTSPTWL